LAQNLRNTIVNGENVNFTVSLQAQLDEMAQLNLGDTVDVELKGGRTVEARITKTQFDCLAERWKSLELGQEKLMLSNYIAKRR
jgi:phage-related protein